MVNTIETTPAPVFYYLRPLRAQWEGKGVVRENYSSLEEIAAQFRFEIRNILSPREFRNYYSDQCFDTCFEIYTNQGDKVLYSELEKLVKYTARELLYRRRKDHHKFRNKKAYGNWRAPQTTNELRASFPYKEDGEPGPRPKRRNQCLPSLWNDTYSHNEKCWKRHRKTQYKERPAHTLDLHLREIMRSSREIFEEHEAKALAAREDT